MAFQFSKLLNESIEDTIVKSCEQYCEPEKNQLGYCPTICIPSCYPTCYRPLLATIPPLPPDIITKSLNNTRDENQHKPAQALVAFLVILVVTISIFLCYIINVLCKGWRDSRTEEASEVQSREEQREHNDFLDQDLEPEVDHPIWYIRTVGLEPSIISSISIRKYNKGDRVVEGTDCAVCLNEFQEDETLRLLPKCNHAFHIPCIDKWLRSHTNCPMCRADIVITPDRLPSPEQNGGDSRVPEEIPVGGVSENEIELEDERENFAEEGHFPGSGCVQK